MKLRLFFYLLILELVFIGVISYVFIGKIGRVTVVESKESENIYQIIPTERYKYYYEHFPNRVITEDMYDIQAQYTINNDGLNEGFDYIIPKPKDTFRILALGDSFTFGLFVNTSSNWVELLEDRLARKEVCNNKIEVINLGVGGYDRAYAAEHFKRKGVKYEPDLVVWLDYSPFRDAELQKSLVEEFFESYEINSNLNNSTKKEVYSSIARRIEDQENNPTQRQKRYNSVKKNILEINNEYSGNLILVQLPISDDLEAKLFEEVSLERKNTFILRQIRNIFKMDGIFSDGHPNEKGHNMIAEDIFAYLEHNKLVPCSKS